MAGQAFVYPASADPSSGKDAGKDDFISLLEGAQLGGTQASADTAPARQPLKVTIPDNEALKKAKQSVAKAAPVEAMPVQTVATQEASVALETSKDAPMQSVAAKDLERLAKLAPAAGGPVNKTPDAPVIGGATPAVEAEAESEPEETPSQVASAPGMPPNVPEYAVKRWTGPDAVLLEQLKKDEGVAVAPVASDAAHATAEVKPQLPAEDDKPADAAAPQLASAPVSLPPNVPENAVKRWTGPDAITPDHLTKDIAAPAPSAEAGLDASEPKREISADSKKILDKIPAHPVPKNQPLVPIIIEHSKAMPPMDKAAPAAESKSHEAMGIKIEVKTPPVNTDYELEKAYNALVYGNAEIAIQLYKNVLASDPNNKNALFALATTYHRAGQLELARPYYAKLLSIDPNNRDGLNNFLVLLADEAPEDALTQLQKLKEANPGFSQIPAQMAIIYQKLGFPDKANENMIQAIGLAPENMTYRYNFAIMLDKEHKYTEAAQIYQQLVQAYQRGEVVPGNIQKIQQRLTFISSNRP